MSSSIPKLQACQLVSASDPNYASEVMAGLSLIKMSNGAPAYTNVSTNSYGQICYLDSTTPTPLYTCRALSLFPSPSPQKGIYFTACAKSNDGSLLMCSSGSSAQQALANCSSL